jgi:hypothetical protein
LLISVCADFGTVLTEDSICCVGVEELLISSERGNGSGFFINFCAARCISNGLAFFFFFFFFFFQMSLYVRRKSVSVVRCVQVIFFMAFKFVTFFSSKYLKIDYEEADFLLG